MALAPNCREIPAEGISTAAVALLIDTSASNSVDASTHCSAPRQSTLDRVGAGVDKLQVPGFIAVRR
jgi:hypothetical protein